MARAKFMGVADGRKAIEIGWAHEARGRSRGLRKGCGGGAEEKQKTRYAREKEGGWGDCGGGLPGRRAEPYRQKGF